MKQTHLILLILHVLLLCAVSSLTAQSFESLRKTPEAAFDVNLNSLLHKNDKAGLESYLKSKPEMANAASASVTEEGFGGKPVVKTIPLLYNAVERILDGKNTPDICAVILNANCDLHVAFDDKTPVYLILDFIATHPVDQCETAEQLLALFVGRPDFDVNYRYRSLLPPLAYLIRTNRSLSGKFDKNHISDNTLKLLIDKGSPINTYDNDGNSLMSFAIETNNQYLAAYFLENGIDLTKTNQSGNDAMFQAIAAGQLEIVKQLLQQGYVLNIHNLQNDPASFQKHVETYHYIADLFAGQINSYDDIKLFIRKFNDKFSLIQSKLYAIYKDEFKVVEANRNYFISLNPNRTNVQNVSRIIFANKEFRESASRFISRHSAYDPDDTVKDAREITEIYTVCEALWQHIPESYVSYPNEFMKLIYESLNVPAIFISDGEAHYHENILQEGHKICRKMWINKTFQLEDFFLEASVILEANHAKLLVIWEKDVKAYNAHIAAQKTAYAQHQAQMCAGCQIDFENSDNKMPESQHYDSFLAEMLFGYDDPGVFYMNNGDKYEFYQKQDFKWTINTGWFSSEEFEKYSDMLRYFIKECIQRYCK